MIPEEKELRELYKTAPSAVREYITSPELSVIFEEIRTKYHLHLDEAGALSRALNSVFLGVKNFNELPEMLTEAIKEHADERDAILKDINEKVFTAFRNKLKTPEIEPAGETKERSATGASQIKELEKTVTSDETPQIGTLKTGSDKLETSTVVKPTNIELKQETSEKESSTPKLYAGSDPYREPIE